MCQLNVVAMVMEAFADIIMLCFCLLCLVWMWGIVFKCWLSSHWFTLSVQLLCSCTYCVCAVWLVWCLNALATPSFKVGCWFIKQVSSLGWWLGWSLGKWFKQAGWLTRGIRSFRVKAINHCISVDQFKLGLLYAAYIRGLDCLPPAPTAIKKRGQCPVSICLSYKGMDPYI